MICDECHQETEQVVYCDCFAVLCRGCYTERHRCGHTSAAQNSLPGLLPETGDSSTPANRNTQNLNTQNLNTQYRLRPYQEQALQAVIEALTGTSGQAEEETT